MGRDIHAHVEIQVTGGRWLHYHHPTIERNEALIARLVQNPKGLPRNASEVTMIDYREVWGPNAHTPSWLSSKEVEGLADWWHKTGQPGFPEHHFGFLFGLSLGGFEEDREDYPVSLEDFRIVYWFDN
jgi:hypothetical protein